jgi:hypothetical protein
MRARVMRPRPWVMPGVAYQSRAMLGAPSRNVTASQGLRRPPASAMAPSRGAVSATISAAMEVTKLQRVWPSTPLGMTTVLKYAEKTKMFTSTL